MSTQIKKNGNWVTVAGGTRMWVGTKAALQAALDAGELVDGTAVMVTDDYDYGGNSPRPDWANAVEITAAQLQAGYTAPADGQVFISGHPSVAERSYVTVNGIKLASSIAGPSTGYRECQVQVTVKQGDVIRTTAENVSTGVSWMLHCTPIFVPWKA